MILHPLLVLLDIAYLFQIVSAVYGGDGDILPPNEEKLDYLSWAPYHWPDCNWCQSGRAHLSTGGNRTTWTTCKYVTRDGKLNPDVRKLHGVQAIADASQSILYNAVANILTGSASYAQSAAQAINVFFLDPQSGMHPRVEYGQVIRGPQKQVGQYLGVLDFRGMVKVANAILIMQAVNAPAWTSNLQSEMKDWTTQYLKWLQTSGIGKKAISAPNNHGSFAANQVAAMNILAGDTDAAMGALESYFNGQFRDQIAASGEQPFEAVRTRPFHYRCFNLEAMITNAKLGDQLGLDFWTAKSKFGATIKDALDFVLKKGPGKEKVSDIFPHVAAIAAVYGDPGGKYMAYLRKLDSHFMTAPYYYYDQPAAIHHVLEVKQTDSRDDLPSQRPSIPWECPTVFAAALRVQLDDGVFVTCEELKPFYGYVADAGNDV
ncbi:chondroitin AC/alginate lyase [Fomitiporia mediterranea MF3/22]|uniref:chondroitin AC/alginate lyase n=1 Tax=Fomitiporia mediterranea (strain MF3/22) TaxID=694068 RepID=UPI000440843C|nr:chondroitin AC/alginate lyase [Fomitiporia mediterranea MF3/22]EJC99012.1 chondroitin AC/alginate lyase [Fomitiporia mediterranea MF3/22]